jgi:DNA polymerase elongation subunit (family B)
MARPKILFWDLETSHNIVASFTLRPEYINHDNILQERSIICGAWKWQGSKKIDAIAVTDFPSFKTSRHEDKEVLLKLVEVINEADAIVAHNGDRFDWKYLKTRCLINGIETPKQPILIDTLKVARRHFNFNSNRLDYIGQVLGVGCKIKTSNEMWLAIADSRVPEDDAREFVRKMVKYNKQDVKLLEEVFNKLLPFISNLPNHNLMHDSPVLLCPRCGSDHIQKRGLRLTQTGKTQAYQCCDCAGWFQDKRSVDTTNYKSI